MEVSHKCKCGKNKRCKPYTAHTGRILYFIDDPTKYPFPGQEDKFLKYYEEGALIVRDGKIVDVGEKKIIECYDKLVKVIDHGDNLIMPGFVDTHIHMPQTEMVGSYGVGLLEWLNKYTFPTEEKFSNKEYADYIAKFFIEELISNGTTTALVFTTIFKDSVNAFFEAAEKRNVRMIAGKVGMDRGNVFLTGPPFTDYTVEFPITPTELRDTAQSFYDDSKELIEKWHGKGRLLYAVTPRFAPTSTEDQLSKAKQLLNEYPTVYMHTHLNETKSEQYLMKDVYVVDEPLYDPPADPNADQRRQKNGITQNYLDYTDVYDKFGLLTDRSILAHSIFMNDLDWTRLHDHDCGVAYCPTSNLFLGSGVFKLDEADKFKVKTGLGTDIGAGTSFSMLDTINEAYKVQQVRINDVEFMPPPNPVIRPEPQPPTPSQIAPTSYKLLYLATLGGARVLNLEDKIGTFKAGNEADFVVIDQTVTSLQKLRDVSGGKTLMDSLFGTCILGNKLNIMKTYVYGKLEYDKRCKSDHI